MAPVQPPQRFGSFELVLIRNLPLRPSEHRSVADLGVRWARRRWRHITELAVAALDGQGDARAWLGFHYTEPDPDLAELTEVARMLDQFRRSVADARLRLRDDGAIFGLEADRWVVAREGAHLPAPLTPGWRMRPEACLALPPTLSAAPPVQPVPAPSTDGELFDLLDAIDRAGPRPDLLRTGIPVALRHAIRLHALASSGVVAAAACALLAELAHRELADLSEVVPAAQRLIHSGDGREREAARRLLAAIDASGVLSPSEEEPGWAAEAAPAPDWRVVSRLGADLMSQPGLAGEALSESGVESWEDDLELDDLLLVVDEEVALPDTAIARAIATLSADPRLDSGEALTLTPAFSQHALDLLRGKDAEVAGACLLIAEGRWPAGRLPGLGECLTALAHSLRPTVVRVLAVRALATSGRPDALDLLLELVEDDPAEVAGEALRGLARFPTSEARLAVREAAELPHLASYAVDAMARAHDVGAFSIAETLANSAGPEVRQAVARHLDTIGGHRGEATLSRLYDTDPSWEVRLEAASALTRLATSTDLARLLEDPDPDLRARAIRAAGSSARGEAYGRLLAGAGSIHPEVREASAQALGGLGFSGSTPTLLRLVEDPVERVALAALDAIRRCGDRRAVPTLRRLATTEGTLGTSAASVLRHGSRLRLPAAGDRVQVAARSTALLTDDHRERIRRAFAGCPVRLDFQERRFVALARVEPDDGDGLNALVEAIDRADTQVHALRWSVRDGQCAIRRDCGTWLLSSARGDVVRDAGWFSHEPPAPEPRQPLTPSADLEDGEPVHLPVAVMADRPTRVTSLDPPVERTEALPSRSPELIGARDLDTDDVRGHDLRTETLLVDLAPSPYLTGPLPEPPAPPHEEASEELTLSAWLEEVTAATDAVRLAAVGEQDHTNVPPVDASAPGALRPHRSRHAARSARRRVRLRGRN